jgi:tRNA uridine 5-carboxymethylaminomethyl modification enzyme
MMTSRSEYRLVLRQDNADERLTPLGREIGLVSDSSWQRFERRRTQKQQELARVQQVTLPPSAALNAVLTACGTAPLSTGVRLSDLLRRPQIHYADILPFDTTRPDDIPMSVSEQVETELKYEGYIRRQRAQIEEQQRLEARRLPQHFDYRTVTGLRLEAQEKLNKIQPLNIGQASRISGVSPADISVLIIHHIQEDSAT